MMFKGKYYYGEFLQSEEKIATNILADRLSLLEKSEIIVKSSDQSHKQKVVYQLSQKGIDLLPILVDVIMWSAKYDKNSAVDVKFVRTVKRDRDGLIKEISSRLISELSPQV